MVVMTEDWIYHERQENEFCGRHALNVLLQQVTTLFQDKDLFSIGKTLFLSELQLVIDDETRLNHHYNSTGNFSIEVLKAAVKSRYKLDLVYLKQRDILACNWENIELFVQKAVTELKGFLFHNDNHWFVIRKINGNFWNLDSLKDRPLLIPLLSMKMILKEQLQSSTRSVYCIPQDLPMRNTTILPHMVNEIYMMRDNHLTTAFYPVVVRLYGMKTISL